MLSRSRLLIIGRYGLLSGDFSVREGDLKRMEWAWSMCCSG
jgi:hypothetical protein